MSAADYTCGLCGKGGMTEREAVAHTCGEPDPVPDMAEAPMTTREAVTVLANQMANITQALVDLSDYVGEQTKFIEKIYNALGGDEGWPLLVKVKDL